MIPEVIMESMRSLLQSDLVAAEFIAGFCYKLSLRDVTLLSFKKGRNVLGR